MRCVVAEIRLRECKVHKPMSKETDISISVTVKDGPKTQAQSLKLPKDYCPANVRQAINEELVLTNECEKSTKGMIKFRIAPPPKNPCDDGDTPAPNEKITFVAIHADKYTFKDSCGKEKPGIWYHKDACDVNCGEYLDGPHVYISRRLQTIDFEHLYFMVCPEMFECIPDKEKQRVVINVTYGIGLDQNCAVNTCTPCGSAAPMTTANHQVAAKSA